MSKAVLARRPQAYFSDTGRRVVRRRVAAFKSGWKKYGATERRSRSDLYEPRLWNCHAAYGPISPTLVEDAAPYAADLTEVDVNALLAE